MTSQPDADCDLANCNDPTDAAVQVCVASQVRNAGISTKPKHTTSERKIVSEDASHHHG